MTLHLQKGLVFNWETMLYFAMQKSIENARSHNSDVFPTFYVEPYLLDIVCAYNICPGLWRH